ncbi:hypothetical protein ACFQ07_32005 [Actinomadura adrarensis]|uniref:PD-(D/E)XK endonuclease-like domain-containing protein n=1 Tax=Actinomadura adrarensis TaxID=1819600 RepID=A0ABW3CR50_9ACTN
MRATYRSRLPTTPLILPGPGVGYEAGTVGTAIDQRLRLAFTSRAPIDAATMLGIEGCVTAAARRRNHVVAAIAETGQRLLAELEGTITEMQPDDRAQPMLRADEDEERLARMLLAAAWYAVNLRNPFAFGDTPLCKAAFADPQNFTLGTLLAVPHRDLVDDLLAQLHRAEEGPLGDLRASTEAHVCVPGPTFDGSAFVSADADLICDGVLLEFKSTRRVHAFPLSAILQLLGYVLMDFSDTYKIDTVGVYLSRAGALMTWPLEDYLGLLGARRRDLTELRTAFATLLSYAGCRADDDPLPDQLDGVHELLNDLAFVIPDGHCRVCAQPLDDPLLGPGRPRLYCSTFCSQRSATLRRHGWL